MNLIEQLTSARKDYRDAGRLIRRVRHLYMRLTWVAIRADSTQTTIDHCAKRMIEAGMYWPPTKQLREVRYSILRRAWRRETGAPYSINHPDGWHRWYQRLGFSCHSWERTGIKSVA